MTQPGDDATGSGSLTQNLAAMESGALAPLRQVTALTHHPQPGEDEPDQRNLPPALASLLRATPPLGAPVTGPQSEPSTRPDSQRKGPRMNLATRIHQLEDRAVISDVVIAYCLNVDRKDWAAFAQCFTDPVLTDFRHGQPTSWT